jgi:hypothetical protein
MDLVAGGGFTSDIDIIARLHNYPRSRDWFYRTWEVKVSLLDRKGKARSLKSGKTRKLMSQLQAYRKFGAPEVSLLDLVLCEAGCLSSNPVPTPELIAMLAKKLPELRKDGFGYQLLPFEHERDADGDVGLRTFSRGDRLGSPDLPFLRPVVTNTGEKFMRLAQRLDEFFEEAAERRAKSCCQIAFCRVCRRLQLIRLRDEEDCPTCGEGLVAQS